MARTNEYDTRPCPLCDDEVKSLPPHFRHECPETPGGNE
jgi:hypothetical protein